jgi:hypothetical protein
MCGPGNGRGPWKPLFIGPHGEKNKKKLSFHPPFFHVKKARSISSSGNNKGNRSYIFPILGARARNMHGVNIRLPPTVNFVRPLQSQLLAAKLAPHVFFTRENGSCENAVRGAQQLARGRPAQPCLGRGRVCSHADKSEGQLRKPIMGDPPGHGHKAPARRARVAACATPVRAGRGGMAR